MSAIVRGKPAWIGKPVLEGYIPYGDLGRITSLQDGPDGRKTSAAQVGDRANAQRVFKGAMKTPSRYPQSTAKLGNVNRPFGRRIHIILCFTYEAGTGVEGSSPFRRQGTHQTRCESFDDRPLEEICSLVRGGHRPALDV